MVVEQLHRVAGHLEAGSEDIGRQGVEVVRSAYPRAYAAVPEEALVAAMERNVGAALFVLTSDGGVRPEDVEDIVDAIWHRMSQGVTAREALGAYRLCMGVIGDAFARRAAEDEIGVEAALEGARRIHALTDRVVDSHTARESEVSDEQRLLESHLRSAILFRLMSGAVTGQDLATLSETFDVHPDRPYLCFRARPARTTSLESLRRKLEAGMGQRGVSGMVGLAGHHCIGIASGVPMAPAGTSIGVGPLVDLRRIGQSFEIATRLLARMEARETTGLQSLADVSWQLCTVREPEISAFLVHKYLGAADTMGALQYSLRDSLAAYVAANGDVAVAARRLHVHPNTMRYRLRRYETHASVDLRAAGALVELAWALECAGDTSPG
ncbi:PucR family transcriptional regulator [Ornithinimicrobium cavernae]|uniref:PucR family transcriptional regulator n=1 Tax=Ornithinimicrobium cavernae TaxID=2666047 RepID=UPI000D699619|nr:helix-turn-helix domain-containing protein [Ornithinimicrobium cavernae]